MQRAPALLFLANTVRAAELQLRGQSSTIEFGQAGAKVSAICPTQANVYVDFMGPRTIHFEDLEEDTHVHVQHRSHRPPMHAARAL